MASLPNNSHTRLLLVTLFALFFFAAESVTTVSISESSNRTRICALTISTPPLTDHHLNCTTFIGGVRNSTVNNWSSNVQFSETVSGDGFLCGLINSRPSSTSTLVCWRFSAIDGSDLSYTRVYQDSTLRELESGNSHICAIVVATNQLKCWPWRWFRNHAPAAALTNFSKISVGEDFVCGISRTAEKTVTCVGSNRLGREPLGAFAEISAGPTHACAVAAANRSLICWGDIEGVRPGMNTFVSLASGENRGCGLRGDNKRVECWGRNGFSLPEPLRETEFDSIEGKRNVFCGVESSNWSLHCWGGDGFYPGAVFEQVLPGPCTAESDCECGFLSGAGKYCSTGMSICQPCCGVLPEIIPPSLAPQPPAKKPEWSPKMVAFLVVGCVGSATLLLVFGFFLFRFCMGRVCRVHDSGRLEESGPDDVRPGSARRRPVLSKRLSHLFSMGSNPNNAASLEEFPLEILLEATGNFSDDNKIGAGSFGSVYRGKLPDGREVAVKRAEATPPPPTLGGVTNSGITKRQGSDKDRQFVRELEFLSRLHHKNLVRLLGFYEDPEERVLVYEYLPNGTLHEHLHRRKPPATEEEMCTPEEELGSWPARIKVALDAARGIQYLHDFAVPPIIHRDIKSANILLDESWTAKVSDFGLSLMGPEDESSHLSLRAAGTVGYIDPEYFRLQKLTTKSDVYSFGVVLLEILSGHRAIQRPANGGSPRNVVDYAVPYILRDEIHRALDRSVPPPTPYEIEAVAYVGYLAADCVALEGRDRPNMAEVVGSLERALAACFPRQHHFSRSTTDSST